MEKEYTLSLALLDSVPVVCFCISMIKIASLFPHILFILGALLCIIAGSCKVIWKLLIVLKQKNIELLTHQFRYTMSLGFILMILSVCMYHKELSMNAMLAAITCMPSLLFFSITFLCFFGLLYCAKKLDRSAKNQWIEEIINSIAQISLLIGILLL